MLARHITTTNKKVISHTFRIHETSCNDTLFVPLHFWDIGGDNLFITHIHSIPKIERRPSQRGRKANWIMCLSCRIRRIQGANIRTHKTFFLWCCLVVVPLKFSFKFSERIWREKYEEKWCPLRIAWRNEGRKYKFEGKTKTDRVLRRFIVIWSEKDIRVAINYHQDEEKCARMGHLSLCNRFFLCFLRFIVESYVFRVHVSKFLVLKAVWAK